MRAAQDYYENFLPLAPFPVSRADMGGDAAGALFFLFLSAFGFFFSRLLRNWPFAILSSLLLSVNACRLDVSDR
ncbi:MAG: hypothetical protein ABSC37_05660 [Xanthobacteraceae bacterium]